MPFTECIQQATDHAHHIQIKQNPKFKIGFIKIRVKLKTQYNSIQTISINHYTIKLYNFT